MDSSREEGARSPGGISIGGPGGIHIDGGRVQIGGGPVLGPPMLAPMPPQSAPLVAVTTVDLTGVPGLLLRHPGVVAAGLSVSALLLLVTAVTLISVIQLPWLLLAAPGAFSVALLGGAIAVVARARGRRTKDGLDPDVERRILDAAVMARGRLTVIAAARALQMPLAETEAALSALARSGHLTVDNDPASGVVIYVFPDIEAGLVPSRRLP